MTWLVEVGEHNNAKEGQKNQARHFIYLNLTECCYLYLLNARCYIKSNRVGWLCVVDRVLHQLKQDRIDLRRSHDLVLQVEGSDLDRSVVNSYYQIIVIFIAFLICTYIELVNSGFVYQDPLN
jgi:hypothetical protein